jgi:WD40 repeat protein
LRKAEAPILHNPCIDFSLTLNCLEEVNQISLLAPQEQQLRKKASRADAHLAAAEDGGYVRITTYGDGRQSRSCALLHNQDALVTSAIFRPRSKVTTIASGGTDCVIHIWDVKSKRAHSIKINPLDSDANQVCNPPIVNQLSWSPSGRMLAAALGDGSCAILSGEPNLTSLLLTARLEEAHSGPVASVVFPEWGASNSPAITSHDRLLCSAGNDGQIVLWDLGATLAGEKATDPGAFLPIPHETYTIEEAVSSLELVDRPKTMFGWQHAHKPNFVTTSRDSCLPSTMFVADVTSDIIAYSIPLKS